MFSPALGRAFRSAGSFASAPANPLGRAALSTAPQPFRRRYSSSKPSVPADLKRPTENTTEELKAGGRKAKRNSKQKGSATAAPVATHNIPFVPPTDHLTEFDLKIASIFAQSRPLSIHRPFPETHSMDQFNTIFEPRSQSQIIKETNSTLADFIQRFSNEAEGYSAVDAMEEAAELDVHQYQSFDSYMSQFKPFSPPLAPTPQVAEPEVAPAQEMTLPTTHNSRSEAFREHVSHRRSGMLLISVKRQRKLKMKKHKYKKLMKRTRLLRRKLDRL